MVGSVLLDRMDQEGDFEHIEPLFFSTSQAGKPAPRRSVAPVLDAGDLDRLAELDVVLTCQGGEYTQSVEPRLRERGWCGYWIDAASTLRMEPDAVIVLDPVNRALIDRALERGVRRLIGGNCTTSLLLMALAGVIERGWVEWLTTMTYQAASGAGAEAMRGLGLELREVTAAASAELADPGSSILALERRLTEAVRALERPVLGAPLAANLIPWIDRGVESGATREEWKTFAETNKILELDPPLPVDGLCVRVPVLRCHAQAVTLKLRREVPLDELRSAIADAHPWVELVDNDAEETRARLTPAAITGRLEVAVGRLRQLRMGPEYIGLFTVGDQLLWGAAEPLRRVLRILVERQAVGGRELATAGVGVS
jgi:aspartate-semialdehyde dehydrogenase